MALQRDKIIANAEKLVAKGKIEGAIKEYERLLDDNPNDVNTLNRIGDLWVRINRPDEAAKVYIKIADHYSHDGFFLKAIAIYKKINKLDPSKLDVYGKLAELYAKQGLAMEAKGQYQVLADYYLKHGESANALEAYRKISELDPNSINVHLKLADLYSQNNRTAEALHEYDRLGKLSLKRGLVDEALLVYKKAIKIDPRNIDLVDSLVGALLEAKNYDNSIEILTGALESNHENPRLIALLGRVHVTRGDLDSARSTLERGLTTNPSDQSIREILADVYLRQGSSDRALEIVAPVVEAAVSRREGKTAVETLNRVLKVEPGHVGALEKLVEVYKSLNEESNTLSALNTVAEAHIAKRNFSTAATALEQLVSREPENAQHREKLAFVRQQLGGAPSREIASKPIAAPPPPEPHAPAPVDAPRAPSPDTAGFAPPHVPDAEPEIEFDIDSLELDLSFELDTQPEPEPAKRDDRFTAPVDPPIRSAPRPSDTEEEPEDLDFVTEHMTEAEVFAKYGLTEKAIEHLRAVVSRAPRHAPAHERLLRLLMDEGDSAEVSRVAAGYIELLRARGEHDAVSALEQELVNRGFEPLERETTGFATLSEPARETVKAEEFPAEDEVAEEETFSIDFETFEPAPEEEISFDFGEAESPGITSFGDDLPASLPAELQASPTRSESEPIPEELAYSALLGEEESLELEDEIEQAEPAVAEPEGAFEEAAAEFARFDAAAGIEDEEQQALDILSDLGLSEPDDLVAESDDAFELFANAAPAAPAPAVEELGEIDFYIEQELFEDAEQKLRVLSSRFLDHPQVENRRQRLADARQTRVKPDVPERPSGPPLAAPAPARIPPASSAPAGTPLIFSADDIETELMGARPIEDDDDFVPTPAPPAVEPTLRFDVADVDESSLFAEEDTFFDLAAELEHELAEEEEMPRSLSEEEQSLEEIFREFKKGVEQQLDSEDYDTHYNLGIAYKEMGLIDEAIGEFQLASKDPKRMIECCSMLGLCFLEKGMPQLAIKWYRKGLETPEISRDEHLGLLYDLGSAHLEVGDVVAAQQAFTEIYGVNSSYRDVISRIKQLQNANL